MRASSRSIRALVSALLLANQQLADLIHLGVGGTRPAAMPPVCVIDVVLISNPSDFEC